MAVTPIYPMEQNFATPLMATPNPEWQLRTQGMNKLGQGLGQALMRRQQAAKAQQLAAAASTGPILPGREAAYTAPEGGMPGGSDPTSQTIAPDVPSAGASPASASAPTGPVPTPQQMTPPPPQGGGMGYPAAGITAQNGNMGYPALGIPGQSGLGFNQAGGDTPANELDAIKAGIAKVESGGNYGAVGPDVHGDHAYGKYQVMGANVPSWTAEATGAAETPQQFLHDPGAQEQVASVKMGEYLAKYGDPQDVSSMWFSGRPASQSHGLSDGNMKADQYIAATVGNLGKGGAQVAANMPTPNAQPMAGRLPPNPNGGFSLPGGGSAPSPQGQPPQGSSGASGPQGIDPQVQQRLQSIAAVALSPYADPQTRQMAMEMYQQQMQFAMPHPLQYRPVPGTNEEMQMDWLGRPTGQMIHGGPMKMDAGATLYGPNGQIMGGADEWSTSTYKDLLGQEHMVRVNKRTGQVMPVNGQGGQPSAPVAPGGMGSAVGGTPLVGPQAGNVRGAPIPAGMPAGAPQSPVGGSPAPGGLPPFSGLTNAPAAPPRPALLPSSQGPGMGLPALGVASQPSPGTPPNAALGGVVAENSGLPKQIMPTAGSQRQYPTSEQFSQGLDHQVQLWVPQLVAKYGMNADAAQQVAQLARNYVSGSQGLPNGMAQSKPQEQLAWNLATQYDPTLTQRRAGTMSSFAPGQGGNDDKTILFGRTALAHASAARGLGEALGGSNIPVIGELINMGRNEFSNPQEAAAYEAKARTAFNEINKAYVGGPGTAEERELPPELSAHARPSVRTAYWVALGQQLQDKIEKMQEGYHNGAGNVPDFPLLDPEDQANLQHLEAPYQGKTAKNNPAASPVHMGSPSNPPITQRDMDYLRAHPEKAAQFDKQFGPNASKYVLGR